MLTVGESAWFAYQMAAAHSSSSAASAQQSSAQARAHVRAVLQKLGLLEAWDTKVGVGGVHWAGGMSTCGMSSPLQRCRGAPQRRGGLLRAGVG